MDILNDLTKKFKVSQIIMYMIISLEEHIPTKIPILLGSSSSNRRKIIKYLGWDINYDSPNIDEKQIRTNNAYELPLKIAYAKSDALLSKLNNETLLINVINKFYD